jgi:hypothetical protein
MADSFNSLENVWDGLLSCRPGEVRSVFSTLAVEERAAVILHLQRMANEAGWQPEQRHSAQIALQALEGLTGTS